MLSFDRFLMEDGIPIYLQIVRHVKREIVAGLAGDQDEMPSRRVLSALLGVNPNTIQKAYRLLEDEGVLASRGGAGSYLTVDARQVSQMRDALLEQDAKALIRSMQQSGLTLEETLALIQRLWEEADSP